MSSSESTSLADRLVTACDNGDLPSAKAAVADGASVNEKGKTPWGTLLPAALTCAVVEQPHDVAVWLLSHGADPNGDGVMYCSAYRSTAAILQLVVDAGGDVNGKRHNVEPPLFAVVRTNSEAKVRVLLAEPSLDLTAKFYDKTPEQYALDEGQPGLA